MFARRGAASWMLLPVALLLGSAGWFALRAPAVAAVAAPSTAGGDSGPSEPPAPPIVTKGEIAVALLRAGLSPEALACAGVNANGVEELIEVAGTHLTQYASNLATADTNYAAARVQVDAIERKAQSCTASQEELTQLATANSSLAQATAARTAALDSLITSATAHLSAGQRTTLATIRSNASWALPTQYLAENRSQTDWVKLRDALANQKISAKYGETPDETCQSFLSAVHATQATSAAVSNNESLLATVKATWATALD